MQPIHTDLAPAAIGTYSQAIRCDNTVYLSGQIPLDPKTMQLCSDEIRMQINQVFDNLAAVCEAAGGSLADLVRITVYLTDLNHFPLINEAMTRYFTEPYPARAAIGVSALPRGAQIEIDGIMVLEAANRLTRE
ncbi:MULTISPECIES: RidA family protein [Legionella]|uniref:Endoribonuclease L-PSP n=1 Tax=Legionella drozanskii LLAP-1 TaxID=1212489 RepID=A0A0W0SRL4_9GAMM|nr:MULTISPECIES: RidA family protein [Legionella]KTC86038.1 endoribonuclease L-PSP [Legionella drozanskii LLAP-1]PJE10550.1 MAG: RidA family protein [Legionella sp.]